MLQIATYSKKCGRCKGTGVKWFGLVDCHVCNGHGSNIVRSKAKCPRCDSEGRVPIFNIRFIRLDCPICRGTGFRNPPIKFF